MIKAYFMNGPLKNKNNFLVIKGESVPSIITFTDEKVVISEKKGFFVSLGFVKHKNLILVKEELVYILLSEVDGFYNYHYVGKVLIKKPG